MAREVISRDDLSKESVGAEPADEYKERLLKYIPAEVVALYVALLGIIQGASEGFPKNEALWGITLLLLVGTPLFLSRVSGVKKRQQLIISTLAFGVWVFALGGPGAEPFPFQETYGAILLPVYTFFIPIFEAKR
jgi:hypothetical protein